MNRLSRFGLCLFVTGVALLVKWGQVDGKVVENWIGFIAALVGYTIFVNLGAEKQE
jgi:hypothetical protein